MGKQKTRQTLARSFKIESLTPNMKIPKYAGKQYRTKKEKGGLIYIEKSKYALNLPSELGELASFRKKKKGKKIKNA